MIQQGNLPYKLEVTKEEITPRSGLVLYAEVLRALGIREGVERYFPSPGSNRGYAPWLFIQPMLMMVYGGGRHIEEIREIRDDFAVRKLVGMAKVPSLSTFGDWLKRVGETGGSEAMEKVNKEVVREVCCRDEEDNYTLDVDATVIEAEKQSAQWTYKKVKGYQPILGFLAEIGLCVAYEFRGGNIPAHAGAVEFLDKCEKNVPKGKQIDAIRSDSAFYRADVLNWCEKLEKKYSVTACKDPGVMASIKTIRDWKILMTPEGQETERQVGSAIHIMNKTENPFRLVVQRWKNRQMDLFSPHEWCYQVIATNLDELEPEEVVWWHNQRGQAENLIKEVKIGFGMEQMPSGTLAANALYFGIGLLAYNTTLAQKRLFMDDEWRKYTIRTIRWRLVEIAGKLIRHGRQWILKIVAPVDKLRMYQSIRQRCRKFG
jgi:hypothetical protein